MTAARTPSQRGRMARDKGARFQRAVARTIRPYWPDAISCRENGHRTADFVAADDGDLARTSPGLFWSLKDVAAGVTDPPGLIGSWMAEARQKAGGRLPLVVQKRKGSADPLDSWCWLTLGDLHHLLHGAPAALSPDVRAPARMRLRDVLPLLAAAGYAQQVPA